MCDTLCIVGDGRTLFAKNSDRPVGEAQVVQAFAPRAGGGVLRTQYLELADVGSCATVGSRPTWLWGFEHGVNQYRVAVGNEKLWTIDDPHAQPPALIGMDLVRLALERATTADAAVDVITSLLETHGQGGSCERDHEEPYFSSFLVADPSGAWVVETSARTWVARPVADAAAISNRITLRTDWTRSSRDVGAGADFDAWRDPAAPTGIADHRLAATREAIATRDRRVTPRELAAVLRHHGTTPWGAPGDDPGAVVAPPVDIDAEWHGVTVCMHVRGYQATTAAMIAELHADPSVPQRLWVCLGSPCVGVFVPILASAAPAELGDADRWARFARLRDRVEADGEALALVRARLAPIETDAWAAADAHFEAGDTPSFASVANDAWRSIDAALDALGV
jgi:hypothetical protein